MSWFGPISQNENRIGGEDRAGTNRHIPAERSDLSPPYQPAGEIEGGQNG